MSRLKYLILAIAIITFTGCAQNVKEITVDQSSKYFPEDAWGVYSWAGWKTNEVSKESHPLIKGAPIILKWRDIEPEQGVFNFDEVLGNKLALADSNDFYTFLMVWVAPNAPNWLYENGVPELEMTKTLNPLGVPRDVTFQYYLDEDYIFYFHRMLKEFGKYLVNLPESQKERVLYVQSCEGSTGDGWGYKGEPLDSQYNINDDEWGDFRIDAWEVLKEALSNENEELEIPILVNYDSNQSKQYNWLLNNFPVIGLKNGMFSHGYHISETKKRIENWEKFKSDVTKRDIEFFSRGEQDKEWKVYGWSTQNPKQGFYWAGIFATHGGIDMWNVPAEASMGYEYQDAINFFNKYAGHHNAEIAPAAFCALRKGLDASDIEAYPEEEFGKDQKQNIDRYLKIADKYKEFGAIQGDPEKATGGGMINRKRQDYNDVGWGIHDGNYQRFISQIDPEETSLGWWHKGPSNSVFSRFARSIKTDNNVKAMFFDINDDFFHQGNNVELRIVWLDEGEADWEILYDAIGEKENSALKVKNKNSGTWMEKTIVIEDAGFDNSLLRNADIIIKTNADEDAVFHLLEITKI